MPFEATPYIFFTTDIIYMVAVLSPEMGFTLTLSVCVCVCVRYARRNMKAEL